jgi:hypothetical protein
MQVLVGVLFFVIGAMNINKEDQQKTASILNDVVVVIIFLVSIINVMISSFGIQHVDYSSTYYTLNTSSTTPSFRGKF